MFLPMILPFGSFIALMNFIMPIFPFPTSSLPLFLIFSLLPSTSSFSLLMMALLGLPVRPFPLFPFPPLPFPCSSFLLFLCSYLIIHFALFFLPSPLSPFPSPLSLFLLFFAPYGSLFPSIPPLLPFLLLFLVLLPSLPPLPASPGAYLLP